MKKMQVYSTQVKPKKRFNRTEKIEIRCTRLEKELITDHAGKLSVSNYLRTLGLKNKVKPPYGPEFFEMISQLKYTGNNMNQLLKKIHANKDQIKDYKNLDTLLEFLENNWALLVEIKNIFFSLK